MSAGLGGAAMTNEEADRLNDLFDDLDENDGAPDMELLAALTKLSVESKAEFVRRMDERYDVNSPQAR